MGVAGENGWVGGGGQTRKSQSESGQKLKEIKTLEKAEKMRGTFCPAGPSGSAEGS